MNALDAPLDRLLPADANLPRSDEAEESVLGCLLLDNGSLERAGSLAAEHFFDQRRCSIFRAAAELIRAGQPADVITVHARLREVDPAAAASGLVYLQELATCVTSAANIGQHAAIVRDKATLRELVAAGARIANVARNTGSVADTLDVAREEVERLQEAATPARAAAKALNFTALARQKAPPRPWVRPGWLGFEPTLLAGGGGTGKSGLMQHEATCGALGRAYFAPACEPYVSLVWNCEDGHDDLWRRQERICEHEGVDMADLAGRLHVVSRYGHDNALMVENRGQLVPTPLMQALRQQLNDLRATGLWLDNAAHLLLANHDDRTIVTTFINALAGLVVGRPFFFVLAGHTARVAGSEFSGSAAWENAVRMRWFLGAQLPDQKPEEGDEPRSDARFLAKRKSNYSAQDYVRLMMRDGLLVPDQEASSHVGGVLAAFDERKAEEVCVAGFKALQAMGIAPTDTSNSPSFLPKHILAKGLAEGFGKSDLKRAMDRLMARGKFSHGPVGQYPNRTQRMGLILHEE